MSSIEISVARFSYRRSMHPFLHLRPKEKVVARNLTRKLDGLLLLCCSVFISFRIARG